MSVAHATVEAALPTWHAVYSQGAYREWTYCGYRGHNQTLLVDEVTCPICIDLMEAEANGKDVAPCQSARIVRAMGG